jgi:hypothetical protein
MRHGLKKLLPLQMTVLHTDVIAARALQLRDLAGETPRDRYRDSPEDVLQALLRDAAVAQSGADAVHRQLLLLQLRARHWRVAPVDADAKATAEAAAERDKEQLAVRAVLRLHSEVTRHYYYYYYDCFSVSAVVIVALPVLLRIAVVELLLRSLL